MSQSSVFVERGTGQRARQEAQQQQQPSGVARKFNEGFRRCASAAATAVGSKWAFVLACVVVLAWAVTGPVFHYSDTWQLVINTGTTIVTFLMVFLIQNTQNRDAKAIHLKLDELLRGVEGARTAFVDLEELPDQDLKALAEEFRALRARQDAIETKGHHMHREFHASHPEVDDEEAHDIIDGRKEPDDEPKA
jgi:low affinity Fe/Cu permease